MTVLFYYALHSCIRRLIVCLFLCKNNKRNNDYSFGDGKGADIGNSFIFSEKAVVPGCPRICSTIKKF